MRTIIIEDELGSRETLKKFLDKYCPDIVVSGEAGNLKEALEVIEREVPDLIFLDVRLSAQENGFQILDNTGNFDFEVIFLSAYKEYASQAFRENACDYLLKPINPDFLQEAVNRAIERRKQKKQEVILKKLNKQSLKFKIPLHGGFELISIKDILMCKASNSSTTFFFLNGRKKVVSRELLEVEKMLSDYDFVRIHRSYIINLAYVKAFKNGFITLTEEVEVPVSKSYKETFLERIRNYSI
ncbi:MAG: response regulator transcription factor [Phaeodactylibacter sp.]|nr:response regulator transcription factor [Phaeodactylibacter sp.]